MKKILTSLVLAAVALLSAPGVSAQTTPPANHTDSVADAFGTIMGAIIKGNIEQAQQMGLGAIDTERVIAALNATLRGQQTAFSPQEADAFLAAIQQASRPEPKNADPAKQAEFIAQMAKTDGAVTTPSGLVFITMVEGEGAMPRDDQHVVVEYVGRLADGTVFDQTAGDPATFDLVHLIPGFIEGLKMMRPGGTYRIIIPSNLGYGPSGIGGVIPGNAALDFTVQLLEVK